MPGRRYDFETGRWGSSSGSGWEEHDEGERDPAEGRLEKERRRKESARFTERVNTPPHRRR